METKNIKGFDPIIIGDSLRKLREKKKLTQMDVVQALGMSYCHYARIEEGVRGMSINMLFKLMEFFQTDANTILGISMQEVA